MQQWKLILAYDGTSYHGWQVQPGLLTIQGLLSDAIHRTTGERVLPQGSGRTDAGVHALGQVASFALAAPIPPANLHRALNRCLPPSIRVLGAEVVFPEFHARHSAIRKTYEYRIFPLRRTPSDAENKPLPEQICPPTLAPYVWPCTWPLSLDALNQAARHVLGEHDFTTFAASDPDLATRTDSERETPSLPGTPRLQPWVSSRCDEHGALAPGECSSKSTPIRAIFCSQWHTVDQLLVYRVTANGFLHHMVRNLVGTFVQTGADRVSPDSIPTLLAARNRSAGGPTAPPQGLFLVNVEYDEPGT